MPTAQGPTTKLERSQPLLAAIRVVVELGQHGGESIVVHAASGERPLVGTSPACALRLRDPHVSRRHLLLEPSEEGLLVRDVGSTNGTTIHGVRIREAIVGIGARIVIGETTLRVDAADEADAPPPGPESFGRMVGASRAIRRVFGIGLQLAPKGTPVLLEGDAGTGKTLFAEALHESGPRAAFPFIAFDASEVPPSRAAAILFGDSKTPGLLSEADQGTVLIQEATALSLDAQRKLLHLIQRGELLAPDGGKANRARLVLTSRVDVDAAVEDGRMREDLFSALVPGRVALPPLAGRTQDIDVLARHLWQRNGGNGTIPGALLERYAGYRWPGNVRELEAAIARHAAVGANDDLPALESDRSAFDAVLERDLPIARAREEIVEIFERRYVDRVLRRYGSVAAAAAASGLALRYFRSLKAKYGYGAK